MNLIFGHHYNVKNRIAGNAKLTQSAILKHNGSWLAIDNYPTMMWK